MQKVNSFTIKKNGAVIVHVVKKEDALRFPKL